MFGDQKLNLLLLDQVLGAVLVLEVELHHCIELCEPHTQQSTMLQRDIGSSLS